MKMQQLLTSTCCALGIWMASVADSKASEVLYDGIGFFTGQQSFEDSFSLGGPGTLTVTVKDIAWPVALSQLNFLVSDAQSLLGPEMSAGTVSYNVTGAEKLFVQLFGTAQGSLNTGVYALNVEWTPATSTSVPLPAAVTLLLSGLAPLAWQRRQRKGVQASVPG